MILIGMDCTARGLCTFAESLLPSAPPACYPLLAPSPQLAEGDTAPSAGLSRGPWLQNQSWHAGEEEAHLNLNPKQSILLHLQSTTSSITCTFKKSQQTCTLLSAHLFLFQVYFTAAFVSRCH